ncbi:MAG: ROK family glucokinase [Parasporobacterium sp.]|nr:ROK family glucokinase [Parasporobacterium sp.]
MKKYAFGVDIGGTTVKMGLFETNGTLLDTWEIPTVTENNGVAILPDISRSISEKLSEKDISADDVEGIGMGVPGPVGSDGTVFKCVNLGWGIINVEQILSELTGLKVKAGNDANVAAMGEMWQGGGKGYRNVVMITLGTGVGGGVIVDGKIVAGAHGAAGEIGHIPAMEGETETCGCGKKGCLEQYASANGFTRITAKYLAENPEVKTVLRDAETLSSKVIFDAAKAGDEAALHMVDEVGRILGRALATVSCVADPEVFVLGGGMSKSGPILTDTIEKYFKEYAFHASRGTELKLATLGNLAGIYGGVGMVIGD